MKLTFLGADHEVTGSCTLIEINGKYGLVDCGMEQGRDMFVNRDIPVAANMLDFVLLTHAHIDHSGKLPLLYKNGFKGSIYATESTCRLATIMLRDSAHIQEFEAEWRNRKGKRAGTEPYEPIYTMEDADEAIAHLRSCAYETDIPIDEGVTIRFTDIGHLLGSACIQVWLTEAGVTRKVVFSGDVGNKGQPIIKDPQKVEQADFVLIESTYGDRLHEPRPVYTDYLAGLIQKTLDRGGNVVIPSFAVGRTQELLYFIREIKNRSLVTGHGVWPVWVDSPLAGEATGVFLQTDTSDMDDETKALVYAGINPLVFPGLQVSVSSEESKAINTDKTPKVIISASGMCEAGRIRHHLKHNLWRPESLILFVGFQAPGTLGRAILDGSPKVKLFGEEVAVKAEIGTLPGKSGHADRDGLLDWLSGFREKPTMVFVNHGEAEVCAYFTDLLTRQYGYNAYAPYSGTVYDLIETRFTEITAGIPIERETARDPRAATAHKKLMDAGSQLVALMKRSEGMSNKDLAAFASQVEALIKKWE